MKLLSLIAVFTMMVGLSVAQATHIRTEPGMYTIMYATQLLGIEKDFEMLRDGSMGVVARVYYLDDRGMQSVEKLEFRLLDYSLIEGSDGLYLTNGCANMILQDGKSRADIVRMDVRQTRTDFFDDLNLMEDKGVSQCATKDSISTTQDQRQGVSVEQSSQQGQAQSVEEQSSQSQAQGEVYEQSNQDQSQSQSQAQCSKVLTKKTIPYLSFVLDLNIDTSNMVCAEQKTQSQAQSKAQEQTKTKVVNQIQQKTQSTAQEQGRSQSSQQH